MGAKTVPTKKFRKFLKHIGLKHIRTTDSHELWDNPEKPLLRPITIDKNYPDVPLLHIHTNLKTIGITKEEFSKIIKTMLIR
jgi:hypothetical protein